MIQRYTVSEYSIDCDCENGEYVLYAEHLAEVTHLTAENEQQAEIINNLTVRWGKLVKENTELKERLMGKCTIEVDPNCDLAKESKEGM